MSRFPSFHEATNTPRIVPAVECSRTLPATPATPTTESTESPPEVAEVAGSSRVLPTEGRIWSHPEVMALPVMPCTTCVKFKWGRRPSCARYQSLADPKKGCRCVHYEGRA